MANLELPNDIVLTIPIMTRTAAGVIEPAPAGDVFTVVSANPASLNTVIGVTAAGGPAVDVNALVQLSSNLAFTVSDAAGLASFTQVVDVVADVTPTNIVLDLADATSVSQPVPAAPGP